MPVTCTEIIHEIDESGFREIDYLMTGCAFDSHNALGNLVREEGHKNDMVAHAREKGLQIKPEVQFIVRFNTFSRRFPCDLLVENSIIYECKFSTFKRLGSGTLQTLIRRRTSPFSRSQADPKKKEIPVCRENTFLCHQPLLQLTDGSALHITSFPHLNRSQTTNLLKLKALTRLKQLHWINFSLPEITFRTL